MWCITFHIKIIKKKIITWPWSTKLRFFHSRFRASRIYRHNIKEHKNEVLSPHFYYLVAYEKNFWFWKGEISVTVFFFFFLFVKMMVWQLTMAVRALNRVSRFDDLSFIFCHVTVKQSEVEVSEWCNISPAIVHDGIWERMGKSLNVFN